VSGPKPLFPFRKISNAALETRGGVFYFSRVEGALMGLSGLLEGRPAMGGSIRLNLAPCRRFVAMTSLDFAPLFRTAIGFDRLARLMDSAQEAAAAPAYPPYNIERTGDDSYRLTMAVAGFGPKDIDITVKENTLFVTGRVNQDQPKSELLYRGIAGRAFERRFVLADHIVVEGADLENGLLHVALKRVVPEALKPRRIEIGSGASAQKLVANDANGTTETAAQAA
jgi:molecular chaperone IbpA